MKVKLLKKLRRKGRNQIHINSTTTTNGLLTGMSVAYSQDIYSSLYDFGDTEDDVLKKAETIYIKKNLPRLRKKYKK